MRPIALVLTCSAASASLLLLACEKDATEASKDAVANTAPTAIVADPSVEASEPKSEAKPEAKPAGKPEAKPKPEPAPPPNPAEPAEPAEPAKPATPGMPTFHRALEGERPWLHPMADGGLLVSVGPQIYVVDASGALTYDPSLLAGLPYPLSADDAGEPQSWHWDLDVTGRWPDLVLASYWVAEPPRTDYVVRATFKLRDGRFEPMALGGSDHAFYYVDARPYVDGSILALKRVQAKPPKGLNLSDCNEDDASVVRRCEAHFAAVRRKTASGKQLVVVRGLPQGPDLAKALGRRPPTLAYFDSLGSGHVFAATTETRARMLVVTPSEARLMALPGGSSEPLRISLVRAYAEDLAFAAGTQGEWSDGVVKLFRWDGRAWTEETAPPCVDGYEVSDFLQLPSGDRFALCAAPPEIIHGPVWWQRAGEGWVALEQQGAVLAQRPGGHLWVGDEGGAFTTEPVARELKAESRDALDRKLLADGPKALALESNW